MYNSSALFAWCPAEDEEGGEEEKEGEEGEVGEEERSACLNPRGVCSLMFSSLGV